VSADDRLLPAQDQWHRVIVPDGAEFDWSGFRIGDCQFHLEPLLTNTASRRAVLLLRDEKPVGYLGEPVATYMHHELLRLSRIGVRVLVEGRVVSHGDHFALYRCVNRAQMERWVDAQVGRTR